MLFINILVLFTCFNAHSAEETDLPELMTKQSINNIRYLSKDGKITYYQNNSGELKFSSNYQGKLIKKSSKQTHFLVSSSQDEKWVAVEEITNPHRPLPGVEIHRISISKFADDKLTMIGLGTNPKFHLNNRFITYFNPKERKIYIKEVANLENTRSVQVFDRDHTLFIPIAHLITENDLVFTDINSKGISAVLSYSIAEKKITTVYKSTSPNLSLDICLEKNQIIIGEFPRYDLDYPSQIFKMNLFNNLNYKEKETLYSNQSSDVGNMVCKGDEIYFIKTVGVNRKLNSKETEVASLNMETKKIVIRSKLGDITQLTQMGSYVLAPYRGSYLIVSGKTSLIDDSIKKGAQ